MLRLNISLLSLGILDIVFIVLILLLIYIVIYYIQNKIKSSIIYDELLNFCEENKYTYIIHKNQKYDITIENDEFLMYIRLVKLPKDSIVTVNSKSTWQLKYGKRKQKREYLSSRFLNEIVPFLNFNPTSEEKKIIRLVLFYPTCDMILKYLNESEIKEVKTTDTVYGFKTMPYNKFYENFKDLFIDNNKVDSLLEKKELTK